MKETLVTRIMIDSGGDSLPFNTDPSRIGYKKVDEWTDGEVRFINYQGTYKSSLIGDMDVNIIELYKIEK